MRTAYAPLFEALGSPETASPATWPTSCGSVTDYSQHHVDQTVESFWPCVSAPTSPAGGLRIRPRPPAQIRFTIETRISGLARLAEGLQEARTCIEHGLHRPAYVSAWNGYVALALTLLAAEDFAAVRTVRSSWKVTSIEDLSMKTPAPSS